VYGKVIIKNRWVSKFHVEVSNVISKILDFGATAYSNHTIIVTYIPSMQCRIRIPRRRNLLMWYFFCFFFFWSDEVTQFIN